MNFVSLTELHIKLGAKELLAPCSQTIEQGQMVAIIGANGVGKTTLLKIIAGLHKLAQGTLTIDGLSFTNEAQALKLRSLIGYAPDTPPLYAQDTVYSYLRFIAELKRIPNRKNRLAEIFAIFDLHDIQHQYLHTLSKGMQQRVNLAQAVLHNPQLLLLDEPIDGLDATQTLKFKDYLLQLQQKNVTIIYTSHTYSDLLAISDYMLKIENATLSKILLPARIPRDVQVYDHANCPA